MTGPSAMRASTSASMSDASPAAQAAKKLRTVATWSLTAVVCGSGIAVSVMVACLVVDALVRQNTPAGDEITGAGADAREPATGLRTSARPDATLRIASLRE